MNIRAFEDEKGNIWIVTRTASRMEVKGRRNVKDRLHDVARSCALKLGVTQTKSGTPLEYINEHRRIWTAIWDRGQRA